MTVISEQQAVYKGYYRNTGTHEMAKKQTELEKQVWNRYSVRGSELQAANKQLTCCGW